jgi:hypothetical protein
VRHPLAAYDLSRDRLYGACQAAQALREVPVFLRYVRSLYPPRVRLGLVLDNYSPTCRRAGLRAHQSLLAQRIEAQFTALRYFAVDGTDHSEQASIIRRYRLAEPQCPRSPPRRNPR